MLHEARTTLFKSREEDFSSCQNNYTEALKAQKSQVLDMSSDEPSDADNAFMKARIALVEAVREYDSTPAGQKELQESYDNSTDDSEKRKYSARLNRGKGTRKKQLEAYQQAHRHASLSEEDEQTTINEESSNDHAFIDDEKFRNVKKMPALFVIDRENNVTTDSINPHAEWLFTESSRATIKRDGTSITVDDNGKIFARRSVKKGKTAPANYIEAEVDPITGHSFGLEPIEQSGYAKFFKEAQAGQELTPGTYELCGPRVNGNPESLDSHTLMRHGDEEAVEIPDMRTLPREQAFEYMKKIFAEYKTRGIEGVVWWGADGKRAKLRVKDFFGDPNRR